MDAVYAAVPASLVGREQQIDIGPMSGRSNVLYWLERRGLAVGDSAVDRVLATAKASNRTLTDEQILEILKSEI
jgi:2-isopropylmalate synthase